jgi:hypothetical protein
MTNIGHTEIYDYMTRVFSNLKRLSLPLDGDLMSRARGVVEVASTDLASKLLTSMPLMESLKLAYSKYKGVRYDPDMYSRPAMSLVTTVLSHNYTHLEYLSLDGVIFEIEVLCEFIKRHRKLNIVVLESCFILVPAMKFDDMVDEYNLDVDSDVDAAVKGHIKLSIGKEVVLRVKDSEIVRCVSMHCHHCVSSLRMAVSNGGKIPCYESKYCYR